MAISLETWENPVKWRQYRANLIYRWHNSDKINAYYRRRYASSEDVRNKSRIKQNYHRYRHGAMVSDRLVDEIRAHYNKTEDEVPYCRYLDIGIEYPQR